MIRPPRLLERLLVAADWAVGVVEAPIAEVALGASPPPVRWWPRGPGARSYLADPFGVERDGVRTVLAERYDRRLGRGEVVALGQDGEALGVALALDVHTAHPFLVADAGELFCVPDASHLGEVRIYRAAALPLGWEHHATVLAGVPVVDPTPLHHEGRWWLLGGRQDDRPGERLHAWYADTLTGPYVAHPANPVKDDAGSARPAGTPFRHDGRLYRPGQDCSRTYGGAVVVHEVLELSPERFVERTVNRVTPDPEGPYPDGLHTLSAVGGRTLVDGKRRVRTLRKLGAITRRRTRRGPLRPPGRDRPG